MPKTRSVKQELVLGTLVFVMYLNDLDASARGVISKFVNDMTIYS